MINVLKFDKFIVANWKLNGSHSFSTNYFDKLELNTSDNKSNCIIICPPIPYINYINSDILKKGSQDCSEYNDGAYTGEVSAKMLSEIGCKFCIVGHSERRNLFNEKNEIILKKIENCLSNNIVPILCIGENLNQRKEKLTKEIIKDQLNNSLPNKINLENIIIAYEPVWSIGTGIIPKIEEISEIHSYIKNSIFSERKLKILYGGSVKSNNYKKLLYSNDVDGLLIGGSSINLDEFNEIIKF